MALVVVLVCAVLTAAGVLRATPPGTPAAAAPAPASLDNPPAAAGPAGGQGTQSPPGTPTAPDEPGPSGSAPSPQPSPDAETTREVVLKRGDTLWDLARRHHTTVKALQDLNRLGDSTLILAGTTLRVPAPAAASLAPSGSNPSSASGPFAVAAAYGDGDDVAPSEAGRGVPADGSWNLGPSSPTGPPVPGQSGTGALDVRELPAEEKPSTRRGSEPAPQKGDYSTKDGPRERGAAAAVAYARAQLGKPYQWGAAGPRSFDCSGLVMRAWQKGGADLPRTTWDMARAGKKTTRAGLVPGDLVITNGGGHVQLYIGDGKVIHAPGTGKRVTIAPLPQKADAYRHLG
ncbi:NlpC/P60 family protein [Kitasatospora sp. NPDC050463]|uniref:C40 family peptidase n=1 Tax=Kitasatospora sp. NPDC050463 TaxID=3155786 RepID=UPI0033D31584